MANTDIRLSVGFFSHWKTVRLGARLGSDAIISLLKLWVWCAQYRPDGALTGLTDIEIEGMCGWRAQDEVPGQPSRRGPLAATLAEIRWLDGAENSRVCHDWEMWQGWVTGAPVRTEKAVFANLCRTYGKDKAKKILKKRKLATSTAHSVPGASLELEFSGAPPPLPLHPPAPASSSASATKKPTSTSKAKVKSLDATAARRVVALNGHGKEPSKSGLTWSAYSTAYHDRYSVDPVTNAKTNALLCQLVDRVGADDAPKVAAFYLGHPSSFYVQRMHPVDLLVRDAEKLRTEWATNRQVTSTEAQQKDRTATTGNAAKNVMREIDRGTF